MAFLQCREIWHTHAHRVLAKTSFPLLLRQTVSPGSGRVAALLRDPAANSCADSPALLKVPSVLFTSGQVVKLLLTRLLPAPLLPNASSSKTACERHRKYLQVFRSQRFAFPSPKKRGAGT